MPSARLGTIREPRARARVRALRRVRGRRGRQLVARRAAPDAELGAAAARRRRRSGRRRGGGRSSARRAAAGVLWRGRAATRAAGTRSQRRPARRGAPALPLQDRRARERRVRRGRARRQPCGAHATRTARRPLAASGAARGDAREKGATAGAWALLVAGVDGPPRGATPGRRAVAAAGGRARARGARHRRESPPSSTPPAADAVAGGRARRAARVGSRRRGGGGRGRGRRTAVGRRGRGVYDDADDENDDDISDDDIEVELTPGASSPAPDASPRSRGSRSCPGKLERFGHACAPTHEALFAHDAAMGGALVAVRARRRRRRRAARRRPRTSGGAPPTLSLVDTALELGARAAALAARRRAPRVRAPGSRRSAAGAAAALAVPNRALRRRAARAGPTAPRRRARRLAAAERDARDADALYGRARVTGWDDKWSEEHRLPVAARGLPRAARRARARARPDNAAAYLPAASRRWRRAVAAASGSTTSALNSRAARVRDAAAAPLLPPDARAIRDVGGGRRRRPDGARHRRRADDRRARSRRRPRTPTPRCATASSRSPRSSACGRAGCVIDASSSARRRRGQRFLPLPRPERDLAHDPAHAAVDAAAAALRPRPRAQPRRGGLISPGRAHHGASYLRARDARAPGTRVPRGGRGAGSPMTGRSTRRPRALPTCWGRDANHGRCRPTRRNNADLKQPRAPFRSPHPAESLPVH